MQDYRLLVVDDAFFIRNLIKKAVSTKQNGYPIEVIGEAKNTKEALEYCKTEDFEIMTIDYQMPPGEDGISLIKQVMDKYPDKMLIMISDDPTIEETVIDMGCKFLLKPFQNEMLWNALDALIRDNEKRKQLIAQRLKEEIERETVQEETYEKVQGKEPKKIHEEMHENVSISKDINHKQDTIKEKILETNVEKNTTTIVSDETIEKPKKKRKRKKKKKTPVQTPSETDDLLTSLGLEVVGSLTTETFPKKNVKVETQKVHKPEKIDKTVEKQKQEKMNKPVKEKMNHSAMPENVETEDTFIDLDDAPNFEETKEETVDKIIHEIDKTEENPLEEMQEDEMMILDTDSDETEETVLDDEKTVENLIEHHKEIKDEDAHEEIEDEDVAKVYDGGDDDVITFEEEDEESYEDHDIASFAENSVTKAIEFDEEEKTEDEELEDLIKEASYSFDDNTETVKPTTVKKSQLDTLSSEDIFVDLDEEDVEPTIEDTNETTEKEDNFDQMLSDFEDSDDFNQTFDTVDTVKNTDEDNLVLDMSDTDNLETDIENEKPQDEIVEDQDDFGFDDIDFSFDNDDTDSEESTQEENPIENKKSEKTFDDLDFSLDHETPHFEETEEKMNDDFSDIKELDFSFDEEKTQSSDSSLKDDISSEIDDFGFSFENDKSQKKDKPNFSLEDDNIDDFGFSFDEPKSQQHKTIEPHQMETTKSDSSVNIDDLIDEEVERNQDIDIYDTNSLPTHEILKAYEREKAKEEGLIDPPISDMLDSGETIQLSESRPDGTNIKQKSGFFSRFFKKK